MASPSEFHHSIPITASLSPTPTSSDAAMYIPDLEGVCLEDLAGLDTGTVIDSLLASESATGPAPAAASTFAPTIPSTPAVLAPVFAPSVPTPVSSTDLFARTTVAAAAASAASASAFKSRSPSPSRKAATSCVAKFSRQLSTSASDAMRRNGVTAGMLRDMEPSELTRYGLEKAVVRELKVERRRLRNRIHSTESQRRRAAFNTAIHENHETLNSEVARLRATIEERDNFIRILLSLLQQSPATGAECPSPGLAAFVSQL